MCIGAAEAMATSAFFSLFSPSWILSTSLHVSVVYLLICEQEEQDKVMTTELAADLGQLKHKASSSSIVILIRIIRSMI